LFPATFQPGKGKVGEDRASVSGPASLAFTEQVSHATMREITQVKGETHDWISIYRHGHDGEAENPWSYIFLSYPREDPKRIYREIKRRNPVDARWGIHRNRHSWGNDLYRVSVGLEVLGFLPALLVHQVSDWCSGVAIKMGRRQGAPLPRRFA
jgi:hypothetical protein